MYGRQRKGFGNSKGDIFGVNSEIIISNIFNFSNQGNLTAGLKLCWKKKTMKGFKNESEMDILSLLMPSRQELILITKIFTLT